MNLPGYDAWKTDLTGSPYDVTEEQEREMQEKSEREERGLRDAIAAALADERWDIYLATIREIVIEELNRLKPGAGEPAWQTRTPVPVNFDDQAIALREAYSVLAFCFNRLHGSARTRDGELCQSIGKARGKIESVLPHRIEGGLA